VLAGPSLHIWYGFLGRRFPGTNLFSAIQRLAIDQLLFAPICLPTFFSANLILEGKPEKIYSKLEQDWFSAVLANWSLWVPSQFINFRFVPSKFQVLFSNSVGFLWNIYLSSITYKTIVDNKESNENK
jgi:peroxisomal membrane protein 2